MAQVHNWPVLDEHQYYVRDNQGVIWFVDSQFDKGVATAVTSKGVISVGLNVLRDLRGPLHLLEALNQNNGILDGFPTIEPQPKLTEAQQVVTARTREDVLRAENG